MPGCDWGAAYGQNRTFHLALRFSAPMSEFHFRTLLELTHEAFEQAAIWVEWEEPEQDIEISSWGVGMSLRHGSVAGLSLTRAASTSIRTLGTRN